MTAAERKAAERQRKRAAGLAPLEVWAQPELHDEIKRFVEDMITHVQPNREPLNTPE